MASAASSTWAATVAVALRSAFAAMMSAVTLGNACASVGGVGNVGMEMFGGSSEHTPLRL
jgi:hypothetical protein